MLEQKKMNKFKAIGLVFKYEFKNASKKLFPLYLVLIILGLVIGLLQSPFSDTAKRLNDKRAEIELTGNVDAYTMQMELNQVEFESSIVITILTLLMIIYGTVIIIVTLINLSKRFKKSMMGDEAYLNLVLPVTMGEQIWGRFLSSLVWILICYISIVASYFLYMIRNEALSLIPKFIKETEEIFSIEGINCTFLEFIVFLFLEIFTFNVTVLLLFYFVNGMKMLFQKFSTIVGIISLVLGIYICLNLPGYITEIFKVSNTFKSVIGVCIGSNISLGIIFLVITQIIFTKRLNLE